MCYICRGPKSDHPPARAQAAASGQREVMMRAVRIAVVVFLFAVVLQAAPGGFYWFTSYTYVYENAGTVPFTVYRVSGTTGTVTVDYATVAGTAVAGSDFQYASGTLTFGPGETQKTIAIVVFGDTIYEGNELFEVYLCCSTNALIGKYYGYGTILNDDPQPVLTADDVAIIEGNSGTTSAVITLKATQPIYGNVNYT